MYSYKFRESQVDVTSALDAGFRACFK